MTKQFDEANARRFLADLDDLCKRHAVSLCACSCCEGVNVAASDGPCLSMVTGNGDAGTTAKWCPSGDEYKHEADWRVEATGTGLVLFEHTVAGIVARCLLCGEEADPVTNPPWQGRHIRERHPEYVTW